jgi:hypothetical protein
MPEISRFLGIIIAMFYKDHALPHFHAIYGEYEITVEVETGVNQWAISRTGRASGTIHL